MGYNKRAAGEKMFEHDINSFRMKSNILFNCINNCPPGLNPCKSLKQMCVEGTKYEILNKTHSVFD